MGHRLSKIYTRTGDTGTTGLGDGTRVPKTHLRIEAYGAVDEANSAIGMTLAVAGLPSNVTELLTDIQHDLFDLGGELAVPGYRAITQPQIDKLETALDALNEPLPRTSCCASTASPTTGQRLPHTANAVAKP